MKTTLTKLDINSKTLTEIIKELKKTYKTEEIKEERKAFLVDKMQKYGYLPYPHIKALTELTESETLLLLEEKLKINNTYNNQGEFCFDKEKISPLKRLGYTDSSWVKKEQHSIKLLNLAALGNGNKSKEAGKFFDWLKQLVILPSGNTKKGVLATTAYIIPFHPREFGCAYLPKSSEVSQKLEDAFLKEKFNLDSKDQVRLFLALTQLCGHPTMYDVLPQTGRFSKIILLNPYVARWFDIKTITTSLEQEAEKISERLAKEFHDGDVYYIKSLVLNHLLGVYEEVPEHHQGLFDRFNKELFVKRKELSEKMFSQENQVVLHKKVTELIEKTLKKPLAGLEEEDMLNQGEITAELINEGFWPAPGGAWNSCGIPVFDKMNRGASFPLFRHFDYEGNDVTHFANLDCQTPYYFVYFDKKEYNQKVISFYIYLLKKIQKDYNFDGFRVDHIDHIVDDFSEKENFPISYRAPRVVLGKANQELKKETPYFATLAEYMLWDSFFEEYHQDMNFDLLWGSDIISQEHKTVAKIIEENKEILDYNGTLNNEKNLLSILKTYNNQDGEFREINQYPGQLGEKGALFKWFKFKFLPLGEKAQRPVLYIDGDESFTKKGVEKAIGVEESMERVANFEFFKKFDAINRFALDCDFLLKGFSELYCANNETGLVSWFVKDDEDKERLLIIANEKPTTQTIRNENGYLVEIKNKSECDVEVLVPDGFSVEKEILFKEDSFEEKTEINNLSENKFFFDKIEPSDFYIYKLERSS